MGTIEVEALDGIVQWFALSFCSLVSKNPLPLQTELGANSFVVDLNSRETEPMRYIYIPDRFHMYYYLRDYTHTYIHIACLEETDEGWRQRKKSRDLLWRFGSWDYVGKSEFVAQASGLWTQGEFLCSLRQKSFFRKLQSLLFKLSNDWMRPPHYRG